MYPGTIFNWIDESQIPTGTVEVTDPYSLFLVGSSFDRGPENMRVVSGRAFFDLYGTPSFKKHGQPAIQAMNIINGGGTLLVKRVVAPDSTLANVIVSANVTTTINAVESEDEDAKTLDELLGKSTEESTGDNTSETKKYKAYRSVSVKWQTKSVENAISLDDVIAEAQKLKSTADLSDTGAGQIYIDSDNNAIPVTANTELVEGSTVYVDAENNIQYKDDGSLVAESDLSTSEVLTSTNVIPLLAVADNGRGVSNKSVRIIPNYSVSKDNGRFFYSLRVYLGTTVLENQTISLAPDAVVNDINYSINRYTFNQIAIEQIPDSYTDYKNILATGLGLDDTSDLDMYDIIYGKTNRTYQIGGFSLDEESIDLNSKYGITLEQGSNGSFGIAPNPGNPVDNTYTDDPSDTGRVKKSYVDALTWFFYPVEDETVADIDSENYVTTDDDDIFDVDKYKIAAVFDANYPDNVKHAICKLVTFREDCFYFRDLGTNATTYQQIRNIADGFDSNYKNGFSISNKFIGNYATWYQIYDPSTRNRIKVTMMYDFARTMVAHFNNGAYRPLAGIVNNATLANAIEGTINFTPKITPVVNQKELLDNIRVNYAIFQNGRCVVQSVYTSQEAYTQLSYINNVLAIQEVVRAVRTACPAFRYTFVTKSDFTDYATAVQNVLMNYTTHFASLAFDYQQDPLLGAQKIFYATISFRFNNWAQTEIFDLYALPDEGLES